MAYSSITKPTEYFNTIIYTGDGTSNRNITGFGFQPDWLWQKTTNQTFNHYWFDSARGNSSVLKSNSTDAQDTSTTGFNGFISDGFSVSQVTGWEMNNSSLSVEYVNWCWRGAGGTASNGDGSITSTVSANTTSGFSVVTTTGTGSAATVGHGIGIAPKMVIGKRRDSGSSQWRVFNSNLSSASHILFLDSADGEQSGNSATWNNTAPTSTVFSVAGSGDVNASGGTFVFFCFAEVKGFSRFGKYSGNGKADGTFVYTGFKPAWIMVKKFNSSGDEWNIFDNKRDIDNVMQQRLVANVNAANASGTYVDFLSNGFKFRTSNNLGNGSGNSYIYMAFAENPFVANDSGTAVPVTAR